jgi:hypothetical protein
LLSKLVLPRTINLFALSSSNHNPKLLTTMGRKAKLTSPQGQQTIHYQGNSNEAPSTTNDTHNPYGHILPSSSTEGSQDNQPPPPANNASVHHVNDMPTNGGSASNNDNLKLAPANAPMVNSRRDGPLAAMNGANSMYQNDRASAPPIAATGSSEKGADWMLLRDKFTSAGSHLWQDLPGAGKPKFERWKKVDNENDEPLNSLDMGYFPDRDYSGEDNDTPDPRKDLLEHVQQVDVDYPYATEAVHLAVHVIRPMWSRGYTDRFESAIIDINKKVAQKRETLSDNDKNQPTLDIESSICIYVHLVVKHVSDYLDMKHAGMHGKAAKAANSAMVQSVTLFRSLHKIGVNWMNACPDALIEIFGHILRDAPRHRQTLADMAWQDLANLAGHL